MHQDLSRCLHAATARADRAADRILRAEHGLSYRRFLALYAVSEEGVATQRAVADRLGISEPSVSRMAQVLAGEGLLSVDADPGGGNRRCLRLTAAGTELVGTCGHQLEERFAELVRIAGVPYARYRADTLLLLAALGGAADVPVATTRVSSRSGRQSTGAS